MLKGNRINLRLVRDEMDCYQLAQAYNDLSERAETDHIEIKHPQKLLERFAVDGLWGVESGTLLITDHEDNLIGEISFTQCSEFELEIGYRVLRRADRGKGYMSEALALFSAYLFETKPIRRLRIQTADDNIGSRKVAEKCRYKHEGTLRQGYFYRGKVCDFVIYGLLREECPGLEINE
jgi:RimJ/RimL family protein N-acetyltransferase